LNGGGRRYRAKRRWRHRSLQGPSCFFFLILLLGFFHRDAHFLFFSISQPPFPCYMHNTHTRYTFFFFFFFYFYYDDDGGEKIKKQERDEREKERGVVVGCGWEVLCAFPPRRRGPDMTSTSYQ
jgi:hypothetical protein